MNDPARPLIIINYAAARARRAWPYINRTLSENNLRFDVSEPSQPGGTQAQTRAALREGYTTIAVVGGDGTLSEAAAGFFEPREELTDPALPRQISKVAALAILPAGTGDDFARGLAAHRAPLDQWLQRFVAYCRRLQSQQTGADASATRTVDLLYGSSGHGARKFICLNAATFGIGAEVASRVAAQQGALRRLTGEARFALAALGALAAWRERRVHVYVDAARPILCTTNLIAVVNGPFSGGGMNFSPTASTDDGQLDVVTACGISRAGILRELTRIHRGGHLANPKVRMLRGTRVRVEAIAPAEALGVEADGDVRGHTPVDIRVMPRALRVVWGE